MPSGKGRGVDLGHGLRRVGGPGLAEAERGSPGGAGRVAGRSERAGRPAPRPGSHRAIGRRGRGHGQGRGARHRGVRGRRPEAAALRPLAPRADWDCSSNPLDQGLRPAGDLGGAAGRPCRHGWGAEAEASWIRVEIDGRRRKHEAVGGTGAALLRPSAMRFTARPWWAACTPPGSAGGTRIGPLERADHGTPETFAPPLVSWKAQTPMAHDKGERHQRPGPVDDRAEARRRPRHPMNPMVRAMRAVILEILDIPP